MARNGGLSQFCSVQLGPVRFGRMVMAEWLARRSPLCVWVVKMCLWDLNMMTSSNGDIFRVTGHLCEEFTGNSPHKGQWRRALMFSLICVWINGWVNNREAGDLRRHRAHYDVIVMGLGFETTQHYMKQLPYNRPISQIRANPSGLSLIKGGLWHIAKAAICFWTYSVISFNPYPIYLHTVVF